MLHFDIQNHTSYKKWYKYSVCKLVRKYSNIIHGQQGKKFKSAFKYVCIELNKEKLSHSDMQKIYIRVIPQESSNFVKL